MEGLKKTLKKLPKSPGVYFFKDAKGKILYIGKAISLKNRVSSYFSGAHDNRIEQMIAKAAKIEWEEVGSAIEALVLEANLIRKHKPHYNAMQKDDKTFVQIGITQEDFPKMVVVRKTALAKGRVKYKKLFGPFTSGHSAKVALKILRKIFPFRTKCKPRPVGAQNSVPLQGRKCLDAHIGLCPGVCSGDISKEEYKKNIDRLILFFEGGKKQVGREIEREMKAAAKAEDFERAARLRNQLFALNHIHDVALIKDENFGYLPGNSLGRIEAYDISHLGGKDAVGSMVVFTDGKVDTDEYRQFRIRSGEGANDTAHMREVLERRLGHTEWPLPDAILVDGGRAQLNAAKKALSLHKLAIPVLALAKGPTRKGRQVYLTKNAPQIDIRILEGLRDEAHRFAVSYHRRLRRKRQMLYNKKK